MPAKILTSTTRTLGRDAIQRITAIRRAGSPRNWPERMSQKFSGRRPWFFSSSMSCMLRPAPVVISPISPCAIDFDVVEPVRELARGLGIDVGMLLQHRADRRLAGIALSSITSLTSPATQLPSGRMNSGLISSSVAS